MNPNKSPKENELFEIIKDEVICYADTCEDIIRGGRGTKSNWLFDMRRLFLKSDQLDLAAEVFWEKMEDKWPFQIGGLEVGSIPLIAALLMKGKQRGLEVNGFIVRKSRKKSGLCRQIEGNLNDDPIVIVDDLINSGKSFKRVEVALEQEGAKTRDVFVFVDFEKEKTHKKFADKGLSITSIFGLSDFSLSLGGGGGSVYPEENTFSVAWTFEPPDPNYVYIVPKSTPCMDDKSLFYGTDSGMFYAVDQKTGEAVWSFPTGRSLKGIFSCPQIYKDMVIFGSYDGTVYALDRHDGEVVWRYDGAEYVGSSPAIAEDLGLVFIGLEHNAFMNKGSIVALDLESGARRWEYTVREYLHGTPAYCPEKKLVAIGTNDSDFYLFDAETGNVKWSFETEGPMKAAPVFDLKRNQVIIGSHDWHCYGVDIDTGKETFRFKAENVIYGTPLLVGDFIYLGSTDKYLYIYDLKKNEIVNKINTLGRVMSNPNEIEGNIFFGSNDGCIREIDGKTHKMIGGIMLPERTVTKVIKSEKTGLFYAVAAGNQLIALQRI